MDTDSDDEQDEDKKFFDLIENNDFDKTAVKFFENCMRLCSSL
jgi:hypothetical protein